MAENYADLQSLTATKDDYTRLEGAIWKPYQSRNYVVTSPANSVKTTKARREYDSSKTRVAPVFNHLRAQRADKQWPRRLLDLAADGTDRAPTWRADDLSNGRCHWWPRERALHPPVALLSWLIRNLDVTGKQLGSDTVAKVRRKLAARDPETIELALRQLRTGGSRKGWFVLEGPTYPDACIETTDAIIIVEGKRTEAAPTTKTTWIDTRHQMLRHLDAAWEIRGNRSVYGLLIVEGEGAGGAVPKVWQDAAMATTSDETVRGACHIAPLMSSMTSHRRSSA